MSYNTIKNLAPIAVGILGFLVTYLAYAPGLVPVDALAQLEQARTGHFNDIYPPLLAWLWSKTNEAIPGPQGLFLVLTALYWFGFYFIIRALLKMNVIRAVISAILPFSPILFNFAGTIWTDILVFGCFLVATGILLTRPSDAPARPHFVSCLLVLFLLLIGSLARWNSVVGVVPLVVLALWPRPPEKTPLRRTFYRLVLCAPVVLLVWASAGKLLDVTATHTERTGFANMLPLWDLVGMSHYLEMNLLPGSWSEQQSQKIIRSCYSPVNDNNIGAADGDCYFIKLNLVKSGYWHANVIFTLWYDSIMRYPKAYVNTRLRYVRALFWPNNVFMFDADDGTNEFNHHSGFLFRTEKQILRFCRTAPVLHFLFTLGFWMIAATILTAIFAIGMMRGRSDWYFSLLLSLSAGTNLWPLVIIGPDSQFRYGYWTIGAIFIALLIARRGPSHERAGEMSESAVPVVSRI